MAVRKGPIGAMVVTITMSERALDFLSEEGTEILWSNSVDCVTSPNRALCLSYVHKTVSSDILDLFSARSEPKQSCRDRYRHLLHCICQFSKLMVQSFTVTSQSDLSQVTPENLAVFTVAYKWVWNWYHFMYRSDFLHSTPWKRVNQYSIPADMPACPEDGCICVVRSSVVIKASSDTKFNLFIVGMGQLIGICAEGSNSLFILLRNSNRSPMGKHWHLLNSWHSLLINDQQLRHCEHVHGSPPLQGHRRHLYHSSCPSKTTRLVWRRRIQVHIWCKAVDLLASSWGWQHCSYRKWPPGWAKISRL